MITDPRISIVIETENLGMAGLDDLMTSLASLHAQTLPKEAIKEILVIGGSHISTDSLARITDAYPKVRVVVSEKPLEYTESKMLGAKVATGDILVFADSDTDYEPTCVKNMTDILLSDESVWVAGGDTRVRIESGYGLAMNLIWMFPVLSRLSAPAKRPYFPLNNFAIRREVMLTYPIPTELPLYRGKIGHWQDILTNAGCVTYRAPGSRGAHAAPATLIDWWYRMLIHGADAVAKADFRLVEGGRVVEKRSLSRRLYAFLMLAPKKILGFFLRGAKLLREDWTLLRYALTGIPIALASLMLIQVGAMTALFDRAFILRRIAAHEAAHVV